MTMFVLVSPALQLLCKKMSMIMLVIILTALPLCCNSTATAKVRLRLRCNRSISYLSTKHRSENFPVRITLVSKMSPSYIKTGSAFSPSSLSWSRGTVTSLDWVRKQDLPVLYWPWSVLAVVCNDYGLYWLVCTDWSVMTVVCTDCGLYWLWSVQTVVCTDCGLYCGPRGVVSLRNQSVQKVH